jgi:hypothetical protein
MIFNNIRKWIVLTASLVGTIALMTFTETYKTSVTQGIFACGNVLIPSLFPFFFLSSFMVATDCLSVVTNHLGAVEKILGIPRQGIIAVVMCLIGGFPVGAKTVSALYDAHKISSKQAEKLYYCCVGAGPGFMVTFIGENILQSKEAGILLLASNSISVLIILLINRTKAKGFTSTKELSSALPIGDAIVSSAKNAVNSTFSMCSFVIIFIVINNLLALLPFYSSHISLALEITGGVISYGNEIPLEMLAFWVGFGGICVHFQIFGMIQKVKISRFYFVITRALQGCISALAFHFLLLVFPIAKSTFGNLQVKAVPQLSGTLWGGFAIIIFSVIFLITIKATPNSHLKKLSEVLH